MGFYGNTFEYLNEKVSDKAEMPEFKTPEELLRWMKANIKYANFTKLKSAEEVFKTKCGSCHDQVMFEKHYFNKFEDITYKTLFLIELKEGQEQGGRTHSFVYYWKKDKPDEIKWFENAWGNNRGIKEYKTVSDMKSDITNKMLSESDYDKVEFFNFPNMKPGITLGELVEKCVE